MDGIPTMETPKGAGQIYSTVSGHLYHAGKICIVMVGLPGRGKTNRSARITRYLSWLGVPARAFHLANYRRQLLGPDFRVTPEYLSGADGLRDKVKQRCLSDVIAFYKDEGGQVAVYDAVNGSKAERHRIQQLFKGSGVECLFVESLVTDEHVLARNIAEVRISSPDYVGRDPSESLAHYLRRLEHRMGLYEPITEEDLLCVKLVNDGEQCIVRNGPLGYLLNRVLMFLLNSRRRQGSVFFARAGTSDRADSDNNGDNDLSARGSMYAATLANTLMGYVSSKQVDWTDLSMDMSLLKRVADQKSQAFASAATSHAVTRNPSMAPSLASSIPPSLPPSVTPSRTNSASNSRRGSLYGPFAANIEAQSVDDFFTEPPLLVWTSARRRSWQTARPFQEAGVPVSHKSLLNPLNPGDALPYYENWTELQKHFPAEFNDYMRDRYHYRFPRGESYQDVAIRLEPLIMELERVQTNLLVIGNESVLRVLYGYVMGLGAEEIPNLDFPANQVVELVPQGYSNMVVRIPLAGVSPDGGVQLPEGVTVESNQ